MTTRGVASCHLEDAERSRRSHAFLQDLAIGSRPSGSCDQGARDCDTGQWPASPTAMGTYWLARTAVMELRWLSFARFTKSLIQQERLVCLRAREGTHERLLNEQ